MPTNCNVFRQRFGPAYAPEWGSGGIYGLLYHRDVLYYTVAFNAEAHFVRRDSATVYRFELVGPGPRSGGDTYNASTAVDDEIYFGGWVHAPVAYRRLEEGKAIIDFRNKYSHVHAYNIGEDSVRLLWRDGLGDPEKWAGEVTDIVHDPVNDRLLIARGDGHARLGVYGIDRMKGNVERISDTPALKGIIHYDHACFDGFRDRDAGIEIVQCIDLVDGRVTTTSARPTKAVDGGPIALPPVTGGVGSLAGNIYVFATGGLLILDPLGSRDKVFVRLFDYGDPSYTPVRSAVKTLGGGLLVAYSGFSETPSYLGRGYTGPSAPSLLVYITPPVARVVAALGVRVTSVEVVGSKILVATNTMANTGRYDATPVDPGVREIVELSLDTLLASKPPPLTVKTTLSLVGGRFFGGIPLAGYETLRLRMVPREDKGGLRIVVRVYDVSPVSTVYEEFRVRLEQGREEVSVKGLNGVASFRVEGEGLKDSTLYIELS